MIDTDKYEGHAREGWHFDSAHVLRDGYDKEIAELVGEDWLDDKATQELIADAPLLLKEVKNQNYQLHLYQSALRQMQEDTLKVVSDWFDSDENEWRRLEQALGLPLTPLSWEGEE